VRVVVVASLAFAVAAGTVALATGLSTGDGRDCAGVRFDRAAWQGARGDLRRDRETGAEKTRGALARDVSGCGSLLGRSRAQVVALLGRPDESGTIVEGRERYVAYLVGYRNPSDSPDEDPQFLFIRFGATGRVVWTEAPGPRGDTYDTVTSGRRADRPGG
jgi:hypothetical protein